MRFYFPIIALVSYSALIALYAVSIYGQIGPDYADARYPAPAAWYFRQGCDPARPYGKYRACQIAQASLGVTLVMFTVYLVNLGFALHATWPNEENALCRDEDEDSALSDSKANDGGAWEMHSMNAPVNESAVPFTPRTQAFHILDRRLPQRQEDIQRYA
ncbi:hypothetical protein RJ55_08359 [Drechmeria coniospora]|nr:hypothetical protein RJ55_08359 [Drechmeria coniospora]